jgi:hypothetical protein
MRIETDRTTPVQESGVQTDMGASEQKTSSDKVPTDARPKTSGRKEAPDAVSCAEMKNHGGAKTAAAQDLKQVQEIESKNKSAS